MKRIVFVLLLTILCVDTWNVAAAETPELWYRPDSLVSIPNEDSVAWTDEYTIFSVVRSLNSDSAECLWSFAEDDTISTALLTKGIYSNSTGILLTRNPHDFSKWCVYAYHSGIHADSTKQLIFKLGGQTVYFKDSMPADSISAQIEMEEIAYFNGHVSQHTSGTFQTYLALKYGITLDYAAYISQSGDTIWHPEYDEAYYHHIIGIGNDTVYGWNGCVARSKENAALLIRTDSVMPDEYILLGDDNGELEWNLEPDGTSTLQRTWRMRQFVKQSKSIFISLRLSACENVADSVWLNISDNNESVIQMVLPYSVVGDSTYFFVLNRDDTIMHLSVCGIVPNPILPGYDDKHDLQGTNSPSNITVDVNSRTIIVNGFPENQVFLLFLYDNTAKHLGTVSSLNPIDISTLPNVVSYIEIFVDNQIVGAINLPTNIF